MLYFPIIMLFIYLSFFFSFFFSAELGLHTLQVHCETSNRLVSPGGHLMAAVSHPLWFGVLKHDDGHCVWCLQR